MMRKQETMELIKRVEELCCLLMNASGNPAKYRLVLWILEQRWISPQFFLAVIGRR